MTHAERRDPRIRIRGKLLFLVIPGQRLSIEYQRKEMPSTTQQYFAAGIFCLVLLLFLWKCFCTDNILVLIVLQIKSRNWHNSCGIFGLPRSLLLYATRSVGRLCVSPCSRHICYTRYIFIFMFFVLLLSLFLSSGMCALRPWCMSRTDRSIYLYTLL